jgi:hypothetical protein
LQAYWRTLIDNVYHDKPPLGDWTVSAAPESDTGESYDFVMRRASMPWHILDENEALRNSKVQTLKVLTWSMISMLEDRVLIVTEQGYIGVGPKG